VAYPAIFRIPDVTEDRVPSPGIVDTVNSDNATSDSGISSDTAPAIDVSDLDTAASLDSASGSISCPVDNLVADVVSACDSLSADVVNHDVRQAVPDVDVGSATSVGPPVTARRLLTHAASSSRISPSGSDRLYISDVIMVRIYLFISSIYFLLL